MKPGWVDEVAKQLAEEREAPVPTFKRRSFRQTKAHDYQCAVNGSRKGGANTKRKLERLLGPLDEDL